MTSPHTRAPDWWLAYLDEKRNFHEARRIYDRAIEARDAVQAFGDVRGLSDEEYQACKAAVARLEPVPLMPTAPTQP